MRLGLCAVPLAASAFACATAWAAGVDPALIATSRRDGVADVLIVLADQSQPALAPLAVHAPYKLRRRALVDALHTRASRQQTDLRAWLEARGIDHRGYWIANLIQARVAAADLAALAQRGDVECDCRQLADRRAAAAAVHRLGATSGARGHRLGRGEDQGAGGVGSGLHRPGRRHRRRGHRLSVGSSGAQAAVPRLERQHGRSQLQLARRDPRLARQFLRQRFARAVRRPRPRHAHRRHVCRR